ncbi:MAG: hypothetical protein WC712_08915 [Candidatus Brocadiia bacterium]
MGFENGGGQCLLVVGGLLAAAAIAGFALYYNWRRKQAMIEYANANGYTFCEEDAFNIMGRCRALNMFSVGHSHKVYWNVYGKRKGLDFCFFHLRYVTGSGKNRSTHTRQGLLVEGMLVFPTHLSMRPEGFLDRVAELMGFDDIDFEYNEFNNKYFVKSDDKKMAYDIFGREVMEFCLRLPRPISMEILGPHTLFSYSGNIPLEFYDRMLDTALEFHNKLDPLTKEKYGLSSGAKQWSDTFYERQGLAGILSQLR